MQKSLSELIFPISGNLSDCMLCVPGAFRSGAGMGQAATRNSFYASFSKQGNLAELVAKVSALDHLPSTLKLGLQVKGHRFPLFP
jgi:hypothetical protein